MEDQFAGELCQRVHGSRGKTQVLGSFNLLRGDLNQSQSNNLVNLGDGNHIPEIIDQHNVSDPLLLLQISEHDPLVRILAEVEHNQGREGLVTIVQSIDNIVFQHDTLEVSHCAYLLLPLIGLNHSLCFGQHIIQYYLAGEYVYNAVIINAVSITFELWILVVPEALLEAEPDPIQ